MMMKIFIIVFIMASAAAVASPYPIVTSVKSTKTGNSDWRYDFTWTIVDVGTNGDIPISRVCPELDKCMISLGHKHFQNAGGAALFRKTRPQINLYEMPNLSENTTSSDAAMFAYSRGLPTSVVHNGADPVQTGECIGVAIGPSSYFNDTTHWNLLLTPPICERIPPTPTVCNTETPSLSFEHEISVGHTSTITKEINVSCTDPATALITVNEPTHDLAPGLKTTIRVNGAVGESQVNMVSGLNVVPVNNTVTSSSTSTGPGDYHWSTYLTIAYN